MSREGQDGEQDVAWYLDRRPWVRVHRISQIAIADLLCAIEMWPAVVTTIQTVNHGQTSNVPSIPQLSVGPSAICAVQAQDGSTFLSGVKLFDQSGKEVRSSACLLSYLRCQQRR